MHPFLVCWLMPGARISGKGFHHFQSRPVYPSVCKELVAEWEQRTLCAAERVHNVTCVPATLPGQGCRCWRGHRQQAASLPQEGRRQETLKMMSYLDLFHNTSYRSLERWLLLCFLGSEMEITILLHMFMFCGCCNKVPQTG